MHVDACSRWPPAQPCGACPPPCFSCTCPLPNMPSCRATPFSARQVATRAAGLIGAAEIFYLGALWQLTGDLAAPMVAALG